jgi:hypothetical protein
MKFFDRNICLTDRKTIMLIILTLFFTTVLASVWTKGEVKETVLIPDEKEEEMWIPTKEDIEYQDSMYLIIQSTQKDITEIKKDIVHILERLDYADGTWDSIRYVKGSEIDLRRNHN